MEHIDLTQGGFRPPLPTGSIVTPTADGRFIPVGHKPIDEGPIQFKSAGLVKPPEPEDLADLPPERRKAVLEAMKQLGQAYRKEVAEPDRGTIDLTGKPPTPDSNFAPAQNLSPPPDAAAGGRITPTRCPQCNHNLSSPPTEEPTDDDRVLFADCVAYGNAFQKTYELFGGRLRATFRTLTTEEVDACLTQAAFDANRGMVQEVGDYFRTVQDYALCLSIVRYEAGGKVANLPGLKGYKVGELPPGCTALKQIVPYVYDKVLVTNPARRAAAAAFERFNRLVEKLEARAHDADFYRATAGPR